MSLEDVASLLLPPAGGRVVDAGEQWSAPTASGPGVWGHEPAWLPVGGELARYAGRRERALARLRARGSAGAVHRWSHTFFATPRLPRTLSWLRSGAVVELEPRRERVLDLAAAAAGLPKPPCELHFGAGGQLSARTERVVLRVARGGSPVDPRPGAEALERLREHPRVPRLLGRGNAGGATWTSESRLPGRRARVLSPALVAAVVDFSLTLPRHATPPTAFAADIACLAERLPDYAPGLRALESRVASVIDTLPSVFGHGDLWLGNLLVDRGRLSGVVDWDAWHPAAVPGADLLHLIASARAFTTRRTFGELMSERPWELAEFRRATDRFWRELAIRPTPEVLEAVGAAWWAMHTNANVQRHPQVVNDPTWLERNVDSLLQPPASLLA